MAERVYTIVDEAADIAKELVEIYPDVMWQVRLNQVSFLGVENKEPTKRSPVMKVRGINNAEKAVMLLNNIPTRFIVELFWSEWQKWGDELKQWVVLKALLSISVEEGKLIRPDCSEFRIILDKVGVDWEQRTDALPNLLSGTKVDFDLELRPGLEDEEDEES
jgi:hypothetical protein